MKQFKNGILRIETSLRCLRILKLMTKRERELLELLEKSKLEHAFKLLLKNNNKKKN